MKSLEKIHCCVYLEEDTGGRMGSPFSALDFNKAYELIRRGVRYDILTEFGTPMKKVG